MFDRISLNRVRLVVGGAMSIDAALVPASIESISFNESDRALLWAEPGAKTGTIRGRFLSSGKLVIVDAAKAQISDVAVIPEDPQVKRFASVSS